VVQQPLVIGDCVLGLQIWARVGARIAFTEQQNVGVEEETANAHILAAAPELLEALRAMRTFMWAEGYADQTAVMAKADAAIAKAESR
jgi:hypothetical protein